MLYDIELTNDAEISTDMNFNVKILTGEKMIEQSIKIVLSIWKNEWFADRNFGMPWAEVLKNRLTTKMLVDEIEKAIGKIPTIKTVDSVIITRDERTAKIEYIVTADKNIIFGSLEL